MKQLLVATVFLLASAASSLHVPSRPPAALARPVLVTPPLRLRAVAPPRASLLADAADDPWLLYAVLTSAAATGYRIGTTTAVGRIVTGPICAMALTFAAAGVGVLPTAGAGVSAAQGLAVRVATPLLLFSADLRAIATRAGRLVPSFFLGCVGTVLGTLAGVSLLRAPLVSAFGPDGFKVVAALAAKNVGGGINFVAVAGALRLSGAPFAAALAADNLMALVYFPLCSYLGRKEPDPFPTADGGGVDGGGAAALTAASPSTQPGASGGGGGGGGGGAEDEASVARLSSALAVGVAVMAVSRRLGFSLSYDLPIATALTVAAATAAPRQLQPLAPAAERLGTLALYLFFATAGWVGGDLGMDTFLGGGAVLLAFLAVLYAVHFAVVVGVAALLRVPLRRAGNERALPLSMLLTASNANIGGPATACALAVGCGWDGLVTPALLVGNLGYAIATPLGFVLHRLMAGS